MVGLRRELGYDIRDVLGGIGSRYPTPVTRDANCVMRK